LNFNFLSPWWLVTLPFAAVALFLIYKNRGSSEQKKVSSIKLLSEFRRSPNAKALPFVPLRLILELITLSIIIFGLSKFIIPSRFEKILIVADLSFSTLAMDLNGRKLSEKLKNQVIEFVNGFDSTQTFYLQVADGSTVKQDLSYQQIIDELDTLSNRYVDNFEQVINGLNQNNFDKIFIATDRLIDRTKLSSNIFIAETGKVNRNNLYFSNLKLQKDSSKTFLTGNILKSANYDSQKLPLNVSIKLESESSKSPETFFVQINQEIENKFIIPLTSKSYRSVQLSTESIDSDCIKEDSYQDIQNLFQSMQDVVVVHDVDLKKLNLPKINSFPIFISSKNIDSSYRVAGSIIFAEFSDEIINKFDGNIFIQQYEPKIAKTSIPSEWNSDSALLTYISFDKERKFSFAPIDCPNWMVVDLKIEGASALCSGTFGGKRVTYSGIPLLPINLGAASINNIIALNALKWTFSRQDTDKQPLEVESSLAQGNVENIGAKFNINSPSEQSNKLHLPFKWLTLILSVIFILDSLWWVRKSRVWGR
jgi:hypothetical protein